ncbi:U-box domain-containing protein 45 [Typha latifolia]|uniref:U-box domain-containing protein 45 n=1 Tax=Typha latifolia TaxID=4733 RepID=UPI003C2B3CB8
MSDSSPPFSNNKNKTSLLFRIFSCFLSSPIYTITTQCEPNLSLTVVEEPMEMIVVEEDTGGEVDMVSMKKAVKQLNFGGWEEKGAAAAEIRRMAKFDGRTRRSLAALGIIPSLVAMLVETRGDLHSRVLAVEALIELCRGTFKNKVLMIRAGLLARLPQLMEDKELSRRQELALLLLSISSLTKTDVPINSSNILPFLIETLNSKDATVDMKLACLATLYNFSTKLDNIRAIVSSGAVHALLTLSLDKKTSDAALAILGNLVVSNIGKNEIEENPMVPKAFVEVMSWSENTKSQESAAYLLMVLAHGSDKQRQRMAELGIVQVLLEVALTSSSLAQRRALKMLQWFKDEGQTKIRVHSGPRTERMCLSSIHPSSERETRECRRAVRNMVKQSLDRNMASILRRATASEDLSRIKALVVSSSSKSLPY